MPGSDLHAEGVAVKAKNTALAQAACDYSRALRRPRAGMGARENTPAVDVEAAVRAAQVFVSKLLIDDFEAPMCARNGVVLDLHASVVVVYKRW